MCNFIILFLRCFPISFSLDSPFLSLTGNIGRNGGHNGRERRKRRTGKKEWGGATGIRRGGELHNNDRRGREESSSNPAKTAVRAFSPLCAPSFAQFSPLLLRLCELSVCFGCFHLHPGGDEAKPAFRPSVRFPAPLCHGRGQRGGGGGGGGG